MQECVDRSGPYRRAREPHGIIDDSPDMTALPSSGDLRLVALEPSAPPQRRRLSRRRIVMVVTVERRRADRRRAEPGIDGLLRAVVAAGGRIVPRPQLGGDARLDLCRRRPHRTP
jgi:hypothetical protein